MLAPANIPQTPDPEFYEGQNGPDPAKSSGPQTLQQPRMRKRRRRPCRGRGQEIVLAKLLAETFGIKPIVGVEVGVYQAETSAYLLKHLPHLTMFLVDPWKEVVDQSAIGRDSVSGACQEKMDARRQEAYAATEPYRHRRVIVEMPSVDAAKILAGTQFDFVFIDAAHSYTSVRDDLAAWFPLVKPSGIFSGHDYGHRTHKGVKQAVDEFASERGYRLSTLDATVWMVKK